MLLNEFGNGSRRPASEISDGGGDRYCFSAHALIGTDSENAFDDSGRNAFSNAARPCFLTGEPGSAIADDGKRLTCSFLLPGGVLGLAVALHHGGVVRRHEGVELREFRRFGAVPGAVSLGQDGVGRGRHDTSLGEAGDRDSRRHFTRIARSIDHRVHLNPAALASSAGNITQTLVQTPAMIKVFLPVARTFWTK